TSIAAHVMLTRQVSAQVPFLWLKGINGMQVAYEMLRIVRWLATHTYRDTGVSVCSRRNGRTNRAVGNSDASAHTLEARKHVRAVASDEAKRRCNPQGLYAIQRHTNAKAPHLVQRPSLSDTRCCGHRGAPTVA